MEETQQAPKFNPAQSYVWQPTDILSLEGAELHVLKQVLNALVQPAEAQRAIAAYEALKIVDGVIARGVEANIIKEAPDGDAENSQTN